MVYARGVLEYRIGDLYYILCYTILYTIQSYSILYDVRVQNWGFLFLDPPGALGTVLLWPEV